MEDHERLKGLSWLNDKKRWQEYVLHRASPIKKPVLYDLDKGEPLLCALINSKVFLRDLAKRYIREIVSYLVVSDIAIISEKEGLVLYDYASKVKGKIVEIGTCKAGTTVLLGLSDPENSNRVYSVDIVKVQLTTDRIKQFGLCCNLIQGSSHDVGRSWANGKIDMVFVDGNHLADHAYMDMAIWGKHLCIGGHMLIHDCLRGKQIKRFRRRNKIDEDGMIMSKSDKANVQNAVIKFLRDNANFAEIDQKHSIKIIKKTACSSSVISD